MKTTVILSVFSFIIFFSCTKSHTTVPPNYLMTYKIDGTADTLITYYGAVQPSPSSTKTDLFISARSENNKSHFEISIQKAGELSAGTYETGNNNYIIIADYFKYRGEINERDYTIDNAPSKPSAYFKIKITSITNDLITGTFSCNYLYDRTYNETIVVTDGSFVVKRHS